MTASDTLCAYEAGLITEAEATEQALVERLNELYLQAEGRHRETISVRRRSSSATAPQAQH